ncbi:MAG TPA: hypothetical protein VFM18_01970 [Methanosarcina sp.]|nr:hypothetical protein [Methanosarcina sp.]
MTIDFTKPVQTVAGLPVRILCMDAKLVNGVKIVGLITYEMGNEGYCAWELDGTYPQQNFPEYNLMNIPKKEIWYMNVYTDDVGGMYQSLDVAKEMIQDGGEVYICTLKLTYHDGVLVKKEVVND